MKYDAGKKELSAAYLLWFCLGFLGGHRYYLKRIPTGLLQAALFPIGVAFAISMKDTLGAIGPTLFALSVCAIIVWQIVDAFLIPGMVRRYNQALAAKLNTGSADPLDVAKS